MLFKMLVKMWRFWPRHQWTCYGLLFHGRRLHDNCREGISTAIIDCELFLFGSGCCRWHNTPRLAWSLLWPTAAWRKVTIAWCVVVHLFLCQSRVNPMKRGRLTHHHFAEKKQSKKQINTFKVGHRWLIRGIYWPVEFFSDELCLSSSIQEMFFFPYLSIFFLKQRKYQKHTMNIK